MVLSARRLALFAAAAIPFALLPHALAMSIGPLARLGAQWCSVVVSLVPCADAAPASDPRAEGPLPESPELTNDGTSDPHSAELRSPRSAMRGSGDRFPPASLAGPKAAKRVATRRASASIFVGPESVKRAIPTAGRPTSSWTNRTAQHPAGLLIQSPGALTDVLEPGDILIEAEGHPLNGIEDLVVMVRQAYERGAKRLSGRLFRRGVFVPVTVEPGW